MYSTVDIELWISSAYWHDDVHAYGYLLVWSSRVVGVTLQFAVQVLLASDGGYLALR